MIVLTKEPISLESERKLRRWLVQSEAHTLHQIAAARCQFHQADALAKALTAQKGDANDLLALDDLREAAEWATFDRLLDKLQNQTVAERFHTARLLQPTFNAKPTESTEEN